MQGAKEQVCASSEGDAIKKTHIYTVNWNICKIVYIQVTFQMHTVLVRDQKWRSQVKLYHLHYLLQVRGEHAKNGEDQREVNSSAGMNTHTHTLIMNWFWSPGCSSCSKCVLFMLFWESLEWLYWVRRAAGMCGTRFNRDVDTLLPVLFRHGSNSVQFTVETELFLYTLFM